MVTSLLPTGVAMPGSLASTSAQAGPAPGAGASGQADIGKRFEQMLWAEMLSHAGLEASFTRGGGEAASAFSRYIVEAIAADLAERHPLGLGEKVDEIISAQQEDSARVTGETS